MKKNHALLDQLMDEFLLKNDAAIARFLDVRPPVISKMRNGFQPVTAESILLIYDKTGWPIEKIRKLAAA